MSLFTRAVARSAASLSRSHLRSVGTTSSSPAAQPSLDAATTSTPSLKELEIATRTAGKEILTAEIVSGAPGSSSETLMRSSMS